MSQPLPFLSFQNEKSTATILDLFRTPNLRKKTLIQYYQWFTASMVYYGLTLNPEELVPGGDLYITFLVGGLIEFPAYALNIIVFLWMGRRIPLSIMYFIGGVALLLTLAVPAGEDYYHSLEVQRLIKIILFSGTPNLVFQTIGKFGITAAFASIYLVAAELFPTEVRQTGLGSSSMFARVGSMLAPVIGKELSKISVAIPIIIFAVVSLISGVLTLFLPETHGRTIPDTIEEGNQMTSYISTLHV